MVGLILDLTGKRMQRYKKQLKLPNPNDLPSKLAK